MKRRSQIPLVLALSAVALVVVAFFVADGVSSDESPGDELAENALADGRSPPTRTHPTGAAAATNGQPIDVEGIVSPHGPGRAAVVREPSVPVRRDRGGRGYATGLGHAVTPEEIRAATGPMPKYEEEAQPAPPYPLLAVQSNPTRVPVYLDGILLGNTPVLVPLDPKLKSGTLRFARPGVKEKKRSFTVSGPGTVEIFEQLEEDPGYLERLQQKSKTQGPPSDGKAKK